MTATVQQKFKALSNALNDRHLERYDEIEVASTALLTGFHTVLVGPPGTAKSMLTRDITKAFEGAHYAEHLMTKFTTPDEIFGAISIKGIKEGKYERVTDNTFVTAHIVFCDEVFKANSAILNSLLGFMNERVFKNGTEMISVPLISLFGASNELPEGEELGALFDRFQFRMRVSYIQDPSKFMKMLSAPETVPLPTLTLDDLAKARNSVVNIAVTEATLDSLYQIREDLSMEGIVVSDRRYRQSVKALQAMAWQAERDAILDDDFRILQHMYWTNPLDIKKVARVVLRHTNPLDLEAAEVMESIDVIAGELSAALLDRRQKNESRDKLIQKGIEWFAKCKAMSEDLKKLEKKAINAGKNTIRIQQARDRLLRVTRQVSNETMGIDVQTKS